ncbi:GH25 family lysozyme [Myroides indicus]|uniref:Lysozyme n=1 Tax=Myroides indicus TaxID=1323422 RepID=A0A4R7F8E7_9FLAO|nr:GH25 family lysozyme [Myroides indicus]TDS62059.1 lysozyme [Myroides indicus]
MTATKKRTPNKNPITVVNTPRKKRTPSKRKKKNSSNVFWKRLKWTVIIVLFVGIGIWFGITFKDGLKYFFSSERKEANDKSIFDFRTAEVIQRHQHKMIGFDVSHYQGIIEWDRIDSVNSQKPLEFVFIRATMGADGKDKAFELNWKGAGANHFLRGAYHYYRPNENSLIQAKNFIETVKLTEGDFPPILDIEERPKSQSMDSLRLGLQRWIDAVEKHYNAKPILYSGENYYTNHLKDWFPDHILWIANYNFFVEEIKPEWHFWQFTEKGIVSGIDGKVDLNIYNGNKSEIRKLLMK